MLKLKMAISVLCHQADPPVDLARDGIQVKVDLDLREPENVPSHPLFRITHHPLSLRFSRKRHLRVLK